MKYESIKPQIDRIVALILLVCISPLFVLIYIGIKLDSKGPAFFIQKRKGKGEEYFNIYKFRTMKVGTPNLSTDKLENPDQYITKFGKFLRMTSMDEIPQIINVIKGQMSLVGPRPALYNQYELIALRKHHNVDLLKPGITGLAQIKGRDTISDRKKVRYDSFYLRKLSFCLDIAILIKTFIKVISRKDILK